MKINADVGECGLEIDSQIMPLIDMASIACGGHIGDEQSMQQTIRLAKQNKVLVGAHPSYVDRFNFGRISIKDIAKKTLKQQIKTQINELKQICLTEGVVLSYVKPHGALYHDILADEQLFEMMLAVVQEFMPKLFLVLQAGKISKKMFKLALDYSIVIETEVFADRTYQGIDLLPRTNVGSLFKKSCDIVKQYKSFTKYQPIPADTICFHSDNPASIKALMILAND